MSDAETTTLSDEIAKKWDPERLLSYVSDRAGRGQSLDFATRSRYEQQFGTSLGNVRIYTGEFAQEVTRARGADAVTIGGTGMILMSGGLDTTSTAGRALLAHELTHVAQAARGLMNRGGTSALGTEEHEAEAEESEVAEWDQALGRGGGAGAGAGEGGAASAEKRAKVINRVLELIDQNAWVDLVRSGEPPYRP